MAVYDKAKWHIDDASKAKDVVKYFTAVLEWLEKKKMLSDDGKELLELGIDSEISLTDTMVTDEGQAFLSKYYDELLKQLTHLTAQKAIKMLNAFYKEYKQQQ